MCTNTNWKGRRACLLSNLQDCITKWLNGNQKAMSITVFTEPVYLSTKLQENLGYVADACIEMLEWQYSNSRTLVIDYSQTERSLSDIICDIKALFNLNKSNVSIKIVSDVATRYECTGDLYDWLDNFIQSRDCKNGCQIYKEHDQYYFCVSGQGTKEIHIYFKEMEEW